LNVRSSFIVRPLLLHGGLVETIYEWGDFLSVDIENTTADLSKVWVKFDNSPFWLRLSDYYDTEVVFNSLTLKWDKSEVGKTLYLVIGREFRFRKFRGAVAIVADFVNLAREPTLNALLNQVSKESTLAEIRDIVAREATLSALLDSVAKESTLSVLRSGLIATDYDLLNIDLSVERVDELIATNVISLTIVSATGGAQYSIKLFSPTKPALTQDILVPGTTIDRLNRANVYLSNTIQPGSTLTILVLKG
jgi:hypothetical protein